MSEQKYTLSGRSFRMIGGGTIHPGAVGTAAQFKVWIGVENLEKGMKAKNFEKVSLSSPNEMADSDDKSDEPVTPKKGRTNKTPAKKPGRKPGAKRANKTAENDKAGEATTEGGE